MAAAGNFTIIDKGALAKVAKIVDGRMQAFGETVVERARENTREFKGHRSEDKDLRPTGNLMRSIRFEKTGEHSGKFETRTGYGAYVELGTSHMAAQPYFAPAVAQALDDLEGSGPWA